MTGDVVQRQLSISFDTFPGQTRRTRNQSFDYRNADADAIARRQSIKYHFPTALLDEAEIKEAKVSEDEIRKSVFGIPLHERSFVAVEYAVWRPTTASCRRSVLWSKERRLYEAQSKQRLEEFKDKPYMTKHYPELMKHYPGTWRLASKEELVKITKRLTTNPAPTSASVQSRRRIQSAPPTVPINYKRSALTRRPLTSNTI